MKIDWSHYENGRHFLNVKGKDEEIGKAIKIILDHALPPLLFSLNQLVVAVNEARRQMVELGEMLEKLHPELLEEDE